MSTSILLSWFEIPSVNYERAVKFYESVLQVNMIREEMGPIMMAVFPHEKGQTGGAVVHGAPYKPSRDGVCVYLYAADFDQALERVTHHGGSVIMPKMSIGPNGFIAHFIDSEGNRIGLHCEA